MRAGKEEGRYEEPGIESREIGRAYSGYLYTITCLAD